MTLDDPVQALLVTADGAVSYPVANGVIHLLEGSRLIAGDGSAPGIAKNKGAEIQHQQMASYSEVYEYWTNGEGGPTRAIQQVLNARYGALLAGASVLDIGNGGVPPEAQLGPEIAGKLKRFIAADLSPHMLRRSGCFGDLLLADAFRIPLQDEAVDYVTVNNTIHHFGRHRGEDSQQKLGAFFAEALRVSRRGVIGVELLVPSIGLWAEQMLVGLTGFMPTYVYSANFYRQTLPKMGGAVADFEVRSLNQLTSPWRIIPPVLDYTWFRVPTFMIPYSFLFFRIEK
jgi:SAM-dependent methyltransferase